MLIVESYLGERAFAMQLTLENFVSAPDNPAVDGFVRLQDVANLLQLSRLQ
jgi:hypothetical protein